MMTVNVYEGTCKVPTGTVLRRCFRYSCGEVKENEAGCVLNTTLRATFPMNRPI